MRKPSSGKIWIGQHDLTGATPSEFTAASVGRIPEDRHSGVVAELNVAETLALENLDKFLRRGFLDQEKHPTKCSSKDRRVSNQGLSY